MKRIIFTIIRKKRKKLSIGIIFHCRLTLNSNQRFTWGKRCIREISYKLEVRVANTKFLKLTRTCHGTGHFHDDWPLNLVLLYSCLKKKSKLIDRLFKGKHNSTFFENKSDYNSHAKALCNVARERRKVSSFISQTRFWEEVGAARFCGKR